jgi:hypothetical protein
LVVASGGSSSTVQSFVTGDRPDGLKLSSAVAQLYSVTDSPPVLAGLLRKYSTPANGTIQQALIDLYNATVKLQPPPASSVDGVTPVMVAELTNLVVANGGSSSTVQSFVIGDRPDGLKLSSTVAQLYSVADSPPVLAGLLRKYSTPANDTIQQALIDLYTHTVR